MRYVYLVQPTTGGSTDAFTSARRALQRLLNVCKTAQVEWIGRDEEHFTTTKPVEAVGAIRDGFVVWAKREPGSPHEPDYVIVTRVRLQ